MRIAVTVISLFLMVVIGAQVFLVYVGSNLIDNQETSGAGAVGIGVAFLYLLGGAFAMGLPRLAALVFILAGVLGLAVSGTFPDQGVWGGAALILAAMSFLGWRGKHRAEKRALIERDAQMERAVAAGIAAATQRQGEETT